MIVAQINQMENLTRISQKLKNTEEMQKNFLINEISTSQLSRKQRILTPEMFERIFSLSRKSNTCSYEKTIDYTQYRQAVRH